MSVRRSTCPAVSQATRAMLTPACCAIMPSVNWVQPSSPPKKVVSALGPAMVGRFASLYVVYAIMHSASIEVGYNTWYDHRHK